MSNIVLVPFYNDTLEAIQDEQGVWLGVKRACENVGLHEGPQRKKLQKAAWAVAALKAATGSDGKTYEMLMVHQKCVPMWFATIDPSRVKPEVRAKLERYQIECADVLAWHFLGPEPSSRVTGMDMDQFMKVLTVTIKTAVNESVGAVTSALSGRGAREVGLTMGRTIDERITALGQLRAENRDTNSRSERKTVEHLIRTRINHAQGWDRLDVSHLSDVLGLLDALERDELRTDAIRGDHSQQDNFGNVMGVPTRKTATKRGK